MYLKYTGRVIEYLGQKLFETIYTRDVGPKKAGDFGCYASKDVVFHDDNPCIFNNKTKVLSGCSLNGGVFLNSVLKNSTVDCKSIYVSNSELVNVNIVTKTQNKKDPDFKCSTQIMNSKIKAHDGHPFEIVVSADSFVQISNSEIVSKGQCFDNSVISVRQKASVNIGYSTINFLGQKIGLEESSKLTIFNSSIASSSFIINKEQSIEITESECSNINIENVPTTIKKSKVTFSSFSGKSAYGIHDSIFDIVDSEICELIADARSTNQTIKIINATIREQTVLDIENKTSSACFLLIRGSKLFGKITIIQRYFDSMEIIGSVIAGNTTITDAVVAGCNISDKTTNTIRKCRLFDCEITKNNRIGFDSTGVTTNSLMGISLDGFVFDKEHCLDVFPISSNKAIMLFKEKTFIIKNNTLTYLEDISDELLSVIQSSNSFKISTPNNVLRCIESSVEKIFNAAKESEKSTTLSRKIRCSIYSSFIRIFDDSNENCNDYTVARISETLKSLCIFDIRKKVFSSFPNGYVFMPKWIFNWRHVFFDKSKSDTVNPYLILPPYFNP